LISNLGANAVTILGRFRGTERETQNSAKCDEYHETTSPDGFTYRYFHYTLCPWRATR